MLTRKEVATNRTGTKVPDEVWDDIKGNDWFVHPNGEITRDAIAEILSRGGASEVIGTEIKYKKKSVHGFKVTGVEVKELLLGVASRTYKFELYHKKPEADEWAQYREGKKSPKEILNREGLQPLRRNKSPTGLPQKGALMFKQRRRKNKN